jgi:hypothetical protein
LLPQKIVFEVSRAFALAPCTASSSKPCISWDLPVPPLFSARRGVSKTITIFLTLFFYFSGVLQ